jgi:hypothetical protein
MRRLYTWLLGVAGGATAYRAFRRRPGPRRGPDGRGGEPDGRAGELRAKLAQARVAGDGREDFEAGETPVDQVDAAETGDLEARRRAVHRDARAAIDEMQGE